MNQIRRPSAEQTAFYSDSSAAPSPEPQSPRFVQVLEEQDQKTNVYQSSRVPQDNASSQTGANSSMRRPPQGLPKSQTTLLMTAQESGLRPDTSDGIPRSTSMESTFTSRPPSAAVDHQHTKAEIANLISKAGSPEAVIQYLLKEKHSQSQQNSQLWRLVDKQRAMILGLNKDLERALKDKEKYRNKLKEVMSDPAVSHAAGLRNIASKTDLGKTREASAHAPDSPNLDSDKESQKHSPVGLSMAPYPITPPADKSNISSMAGQSFSASRSNKLQIQAAEANYKIASATEDAPNSASLVPSLSPPSNPPTVPPPLPPTGSAAALSPKFENGMGTYPAPPPRKPPPAPLQLNKDTRTMSPEISDEMDDAESDYDDLLEVPEHTTEKRGRRRTRAEDDRERAKIASQEAEARSASKKSKTSQPPADAEKMPTDARAAVPVVVANYETGAASLAAVLNGSTAPPKHKALNIAALMSPGLPASPRPINMKGSGAFPPLSPRTIGAFPAAPLSPRPPNRPVPAPQPHGQDALDPVAKPLVVPPRGPESLPPDHSHGPTKRTEVFIGLVSDEYPDLLMPPNALPSIDIQVASARMRPSRVSLLAATQMEDDPVFTLAVTSRSDKSELWRVEKDTHSLEKLDQKLKQCEAFTAQTLDRGLFIGHAPAKLDARRTALEKYLDELLNTPLDTTTALELCKYLSLNTLPPNSDETGATRIVDGQVTNHGPDGRPFRAGYLTKKGKNFGGWKARYFVLDGPHLKYYETPGGAHLGTIKLQKAQIGKQSQSVDAAATDGATEEELENQYRHAFLVMEPKRKDASSHVKHVLCGEDDKERDRWVEALIQWVDYRETEEDTQSARAPPTPAPPSVPAVAERPMTAASTETTSSGQSKAKKTQSRSYHQATDSDTLVGVRYDSTNAGETPQSVTNLPPKTSGSISESGSTTQLVTEPPKEPIVISGPKDPQPISDAGAWGNKSIIPVASVDEKKQRKRSFFGFGTKTRTVSDGHDPSHGDGYGPPRPVFGVPLAEAVRYSPPRGVNVPLPCVVYRCIQYLEDQNAVLEEGIFRLSGSNLLIKQLRERFNVEGDINLIAEGTFYDIHAVGSLLKLFLRELPTSILTPELHLEFLQTTELTDRQEKIAALAQLALRLPQVNATLLQYLIAFLIKVINNSDVNKMNIRNVGIVFSPTLNIPAPVFAMFLQNYEAIFGIDPDDYELPSPISEDAASHAEKWEAPPRPSTSSSNHSPHRQPRLDSMRDPNRSSPTPPLLANLNAARGSPTPPITSSRHGRESSPMANYSARYETASQDGPKSPRSGHFPLSNDQYEQGQPRSGRRDLDSVQNMGGSLQHHGSKSRLREETRY